MSVRHTMILKDGNFRWSEAYINLSQEDIGTPGAIAKSRKLAATRVGLLGDSVEIVMVRQQIIGVERATFPVFKGDPEDQGDTWKGSPAFTTTFKEASPVLVAVARYDTSHSFSEHHHGGWPAILFEAPNSVSTSKGLFGQTLSINSAWNKWIALMTNGEWGLKRKKPASQVTEYRINHLTYAAGTDYLQVQYGAGFSPAVGDLVQMRKVQGTRDFSSVNGLYRVSALLTDGIQLSPGKRPPAGWNYTDSGLISKVVTVDEPFVSIQLLRSGEKKRGNRAYGAPVGKAKHRS